MIMENPWKVWQNDYLKDSKNWLELLGTGLIFVNCIKSIGYETGDELAADTIFWKCQAIAAICIWARFIFYLRSIESMSYLARMIV